MLCCLVNLGRLGRPAKVGRHHRSYHPGRRPVGPHPDPGSDPGCLWVSRARPRCNSRWPETCCSWERAFTRTPHTVVDAAQVTLIDQTCRRRCASCWSANGSRKRCSTAKACREVSTTTTRSSAAASCKRCNSSARTCHAASAGRNGSSGPFPKPRGRLPRGRKGHLQPQDDLERRYAAVRADRGAGR